MTITLPSLNNPFRLFTSIAPTTDLAAPVKLPILNKNRPKSKRTQLRDTINQLIRDNDLERLVKIINDFEPACDISSHAKSPLTQITYSKNKQLKYLPLDIAFGYSKSGVANKAIIELFIEQQAPASRTKDMLFHYADTDVDLLSRMLQNNYAEELNQNTKSKLYEAIKKSYEKSNNPLFKEALNLLNPNQETSKFLRELGITVTGNDSPSSMKYRLSPIK